MSLSVGFSPVFLSAEQEHRKELKLHAEQEHLYTSHTKNNGFKNFLGAIGHFAAHYHLPSKKIFISYAWPINNVHEEEWTKSFIINLAKNLRFAGFQVYLDEIDSGPGADLKAFMKTIHHIDHVLVVNSKTMRFKLGLDVSGVKYEADRMKECLKNNQKPVDFIINILLNNGLYSDEEFHRYPYLSFFNEGYFEGLKHLIIALYGFNGEKLNLFHQFWEKQIFLNKVSYNIWNMKSLCPGFIHRKLLSEMLERNLADKKFNIICYGIEGSGKSELVQSYVIQNYAKYKFVYWFNASNENELIQQYVELAYENDIDIKAIDMTPALIACYVVKWLENQNDCLIVLDNIRLFGAIRYLIPNKSANIIITTPMEDIYIENYIFMEVFEFSDKEAQAYVFKTFGNDRVNDSDRENIECLISVVGKVPQNLVRACGYIQRNKISILQFLKLYQEIGPALLLPKLLPINHAQLSMSTSENKSFTAPIKSQSEVALTIQNECGTLRSTEIGDTNSTVPCIVINQNDDPDGEQKRFCEQQALNVLSISDQSDSSALKLFLEDICQYAIDYYNNQVFPSKKIFILWIAKENTENNEWVHTYINTLKQHLFHAGIIVYTDNFSARNIDYVLVVSHKNRSDYLDEKIIEHPKYQNSSNRFVIPTLLNKVNYLPEEFKKIAELSFYHNNYLNALNLLLRTLYGFDYDNFNIYYNQRLVYRKIISNTWNVPKRTQHFVGRAQLLSEIQSRLSDGQNENKALVITACTGMGGVGKTQLALEFINIYGHEYEQIYWMDATSKNSLNISYIRLGESKQLFKENDKLSVESKLSIVKNWLENMSSQNWLILYDNADQYDNQVIKSLIPMQGGKVLITSRHTVWPNCISVDVFSEEESLEYINTILGKQAIEKYKEDVLALVNLLQRLPLALAHACAYIKYNRITIAEYLKLGTQLLSKQFEFSDEQYSPVTLTWDITIARLEKASPEAVQLLYYYSYFHHQSISEYLLNIMFKNESGALQEHKIINAMRDIREYSMIQIDEEKFISSMHPLVQKTIRNKLTQVEKTRVVGKIIKTLNQDFDFDVYHDVAVRTISRKSKIKFDDFFIHVSSLLQIIKIENINIEEIGCEDYCLLLLKMAIYAREFKYERELYRNLLIKAKDYKIPQELKIVMLLQAAILKREVNQLSLAKELLSEAKKTLFELNTHTSIYYERLYDLFYYCKGNYYHICGNKEKALSLYQKIKASTQKNIDEYIGGDMFFRALFDNLACLYVELGYHSLAQNIFKQLKTYMSKNPEEEISYSTTLKNLAESMLYSGENIKLAFLYLKKVEEIQIKDFYNKPPIDHLYDVMAYACVLDANDFEAIKYMSKSDEIRKSVDKENEGDNLLRFMTCALIEQRKETEGFLMFLTKQKLHIEKILSGNPWEKCLFDLHMGEFLLINKSPHEALDYFKTALKYFDDNLQSCPIKMRPIIGMILSTDENSGYIKILEKLLSLYDKEFIVIYNFMGVQLAESYLLPLYEVLKNSNIQIERYKNLSLFRTENIGIKLFGFFDAISLKSISCANKDCNDLQKQIEVDSFAKKL